jgi:dTDP-4-dehydrorhamnose 3,5-epimerase
MKSVDIEGLRLVSVPSFIDDRGTFMRVFDSEYSLAGIAEQVNVSINPQLRTLRGMHFQTSGQPENKIVSLLSGSVYIAIIDLRKESSTYLTVFEASFKYEDKLSFSIPAGCATGWISLTDNTILHYVMSSRFEENSYSGLRFDDPAFKINWPNSPLHISKQDLNWPNFKSES